MLLIEIELISFADYDDDSIFNHGIKLRADI